MTVHREYRGRGFGCEALRFILDLASRRGLSEANLEVRYSNTRAQNLYHSLGFRQIGIRPKYYSGTGEDALLMVKNLGAGPEQNPSA